MVREAPGELNPPSPLGARMMSCMRRGLGGSPDIGGKKGDFQSYPLKARGLQKSPQLKMVPFGFCWIPRGSREFPWGAAPPRIFRTPDGPRPFWGARLKFAPEPRGGALGPPPNSFFFHPMSREPSWSACKPDLQGGPRGEGSKTILGSKLEAKINENPIRIESKSLPGRSWS